MKNYIPILMMIFVLALIIGGNIYLSRRFSWYFDFNTAKPLYWIFGAITVFSIGGLIAFTNSVSAAASISFIIATSILGFIMYLLLATNLVDLLSLVTKFNPKIYGISAIVLAALISAYGIINSYNIRTYEIEVPVKKITREIKAMHWTDIHIGHFRGKDFVQEIVNKTKKENVDLVFLTGDLFDGHRRLNMDVISPFKQLDVPIFFVEGNHDGYTDSKKIKNQLRQTGIIVLEDEVSIWNGIQIIGLNHKLADENSVNMHAGGTRSTVRSTLNTLAINKNQPSILLHHSPDGIKYSAEKNIDLFLAGHTHAGQLFPVNLIASLIFSVNKGLHKFENTNVYVSQGAGTFGPPMRVGTNSEITLIYLKPLDKY